MSRPPTLWAGVVLAAGESRRMGRLKPLLPFGPHTVLEQVLAVGRAAGLDPLVVVLGHEAETIAPHLPSEARWIYNPDYRTGGMFSSVCRGLEALPQDVAMAAILLGDQPTLTADVLLLLRAAWEVDACPTDRFYVPTFAGRRGHPLCVPAGLFPAVLAWPGTDGLRGVLRQYAAQVREVAVSEPGILLDLDTPADYERARQWERERGAP